MAMVPVRGSRLLVVALGVCGAIAASHVLPVHAYGGPGEIIFESEEVRIYRTIRSDGSPTIVVTNLDADGRRMGGDPPPWLPPAQRDPERSGAAAERPAEASPPVQVIVNQGDGSTQTEIPGEVSIDERDGDGTTIIINIDAAPPAPPPAPQSPVVAVPSISLPVVGGVRGPIRYPDHHHFLGYGHGVGSPGFFGGLGLNAGNGYGLSTGTPCGNGFDCMFGPQRDHP
jgi:hypothetical protein